MAYGTFKLVEQNGAEQANASHHEQEHKGRAFQNLGSKADAHSEGNQAKSTDYQPIKLVLSRIDAEEPEHGAINAFMRLEVIIHAQIKKTTS